MFHNACSSIEKLMQIIIATATLFKPFWGVHGWFSANTFIQGLWPSTIYS